MRRAPLTRPEVRGVFLVEPDEQQLVRNFAAREPGPEQPMRARVSWLFGNWLRSEAARVGVPVLSVRPWDTLPDRIGAAVSQAW